MNTDYTKMAGNCVKYVCNKTAECVSEAQKPGVVQNIAQASLRTFVGITSIHLNPYATGLGATVAVVKPDLAKKVLSVTDGAINGLWNRMSFNVKVGLAVGGVAAATYFDPTSVFTGLGTFFAVKLGAELALRNLGKEEIASKTREMEEQMNIQ